MVRRQRANAEYYASSESVAYVAEPYHARRRDIAATFLQKWVTSSSLGVELGAGHVPIMGLIDGVGTVICVDSVRVSSDLGLTVVGDVEDGLPLKDGSVDWLFAGELVEHVFDIEALLAECFRVLRPGGRLVVTTPNLATLQDRFRFICGRSPRQVSPLHPYLRFHIRPFTKHSLAHALSSAGFRAVGVRSNALVWRGRRRRYESYGLARMFPGLGGSLVAAGIRSGV